MKEQTVFLLETNGNVLRVIIENSVFSSNLGTFGMIFSWLQYVRFCIKMSNLSREISNHVQICVYCSVALFSGLEAEWDTKKMKKYEQRIDYTRKCDKFSSFQRIRRKS